jgi:23S rRNA pseudouridine1911/1915/1917 synthase
MTAAPASDFDDEHVTDTDAPAVPLAVGGDQEIEVTPDGAGLRLDKWLAGALSGFSRSRLQALIDEGQVTIAGRRETQASRKLRVGEVVRVHVPAPRAADPSPEAIALTVLHEDAHVIVIDKPAGLVVHPGAGNETGTLVNALLAHCGDSLSGVGGVLRPGIVHRLDKDTSGLMVVAKTDAAHRHLAAQFADHGRTGPLERIYCAVIWGSPTQRQGTIEGNLERSHINREKMAVVSNTRGRFAITHFTVEGGFLGPDGTEVASLVRCRLETGRTHQIRVHLAHIGHPLLGDDVYGSHFKTKMTKLGEPARTALARFGRQALHAGVLGFEHPATHKALRFETEPPDDMRTLIEALREQH